MRRNPTTLGMQLKRYCAAGIQPKGPNNGSVPEHGVPRTLCWVGIRLCLAAASCEQSGMDRRREGKRAPVSRASAEADRMFESTRSQILHILPGGGGGKYFRLIIQRKRGEQKKRERERGAGGLSGDLLRSRAVTLQITPSLHSKTRREAPPVAG